MELKAVLADLIGVDFTLYHFNTVQLWMWTHVITTLCSFQFMQ